MKKELPVLIINLKKDKEKYQHMEELCKKHFRQYRFVEGVYGKGLSIDEISAVYAQEAALKQLGRELSLSELGCALSHKKIFEFMVKSNISEALILEDDIEFDKELLEVLENSSLFPKDWELVLLGHHTGGSRDGETQSSVWWKQRLIKGYCLKRPSEVGRGTYGYLLRLSGAKKLLRELNSISKPIDHYTGSDMYINLYILSPVVINIHQYISDELSSMEDRSLLLIQKANKNFVIKKLLKKFGLFDLILFIRDQIKRFMPLKKYDIAKK